MIKKLKLLIFLIPLIFFSCNISKQDNENIHRDTKEIEEYLVKEIKIEHPFLKANPEFSGLAWYKNHLVLLPQYPQNFAKKAGYAFYIDKEEIINYLEKKSQTAIKLKPIKFIDKGLEEYTGLGSGYEAISFNNDIAYVNLESVENTRTTGFLVKGKIDFKNKMIILDSGKLGKIKSQSGLHNFSDETNLIYKNRIYSIHEANGIGVNTHPHTKIFDDSLNQIGSISFPNIEYRITDATEPDSLGRFYALNYLYEGDLQKLKPAEDSIAMKFGIGKTNNREKGIERILEFQILNDKIVLTEDREPIYLQLEKEGRNWEGIAKLDDKGFLIISDTYPRTILAFVEVKKDQETNSEK